MAGPIRLSGKIKSKEILVPGRLGIHRNMIFLPSMCQRFVRVFLDHAATMLFIQVWLSKPPDTD